MTIKLPAPWSKGLCSAFRSSLSLCSCSCDLRDVTTDLSIQTNMFNKLSKGSSYFIPLSRKTRPNSPGRRHPSRSKQRNRRNPPLPRKS